MFPITARLKRNSIVSVALVCFLLLFFISIARADAPTGETRYFRNDEALGTVQTSSTDSFTIDASGKRSIYWGVRIYVVSSDDYAVELTGGVYQVCVRTSNGAGEQGGTWVCAGLSLSLDDHVRVEIYMKIGTGSYILEGTFNTEDLGVTSLDAVTWTFHFSTSRWWDSGSNWTAGDLVYGDSGDDSRITNFTTTLEEEEGEWNSVWFSVTLQTREWDSIYFSLEAISRSWVSTILNVLLLSSQWNSVSFSFNLGTKTWTGTDFLSLLTQGAWNSEYIVFTFPYEGFIFNRWWLIFGFCGFLGLGVWWLVHRS